MRRDPLGQGLGRGFQFPFRLGADGRVALSAGPDNVRQSIQVILATEREERVMLPQFGGGLTRFLFQPNTPSTHRLIQQAIQQALSLWEPRIAVESVEVEPDAGDPEAAFATIRYRLIATQAGAQVSLRLRFTS